MKFSLRSLASLLWGSVINFKTPLIIHDPTVSPGCTLAEIITHFLEAAFSFFSLDVMVK
jgi:hypothetical protein